MEILEFADALSKRAEASGPRRWADSTRSALLESVLHLAHYVDEMPADLREEYQELLRGVLRTVPEDARLVVSRSLQRRLLAAAAPDIEPQLERLVGAERRQAHT